ncbi:hypothetical protein ABTN27_21260, partial [Acinetobacter baumannii]
RSTIVVGRVEICRESIEETESHSSSFRFRTTSIAENGRGRPRKSPPAFGEDERQGRAFHHAALPLEANRRQLDVEIEGEFQRM